MRCGLALFLQCLLFLLFILEVDKVSKHELFFVVIDVILFLTSMHKKNTVVNLWNAAQFSILFDDLNEHGIILVGKSLW